MITADVAISPDGGASAADGHGDADTEPVGTCTAFLCHGVGLLPLFDRPFSCGWHSAVKNGR
ncbi:hypothetical protein [Nonomuraea dietziae]|uniref:hypothetical protein n=1 Tax=Nonomuraea dietziae TaxID=65515 RepID=UPI003402FB9C